MRELTDLDSDVIVVDVGADNRDDLFDFFTTGASRLLVTSREPRALRGHLRVPEERGRAGRTPPRPDARAVLAQLLRRPDRQFASSAPEHEETFHAFARLVREHLGIPLPVVGCLRSSERIGQSIVARQPLIVRRGIDDNVRQFHHMAEMS